MELPAGPWRYSLKHAGITFADVQREFTGRGNRRMIEGVYTRIPSNAKVEAIAVFDRPKQGRSRRAAQRSPASGQ